MRAAVNLRPYAFFFLTLLFTSRLWAEEVKSSTETPSVAVTGETKSAPAPHAMTDHDDGVFVTLTRNAISQKELSSSVEVVKPEDFLKFDAQNVGEAVSRL